MISFQRVERYKKKLGEKANFAKVWFAVKALGAEY